MLNFVHVQPKEPAAHAAPADGACGTCRRTRPAPSPQPPTAGQLMPGSMSALHSGLTQAQAHLGQRLLVLPLREVVDVAVRARLRGGPAREVQSQQRPVGHVTAWAGKLACCLPQATPRLEAASQPHLQARQQLLFDRVLQLRRHLGLGLLALQLLLLAAQQTRAEPSAREHWRACLPLASLRGKALHATVLL